MNFVRNILFSVLLIGVFANFARNDYSIDMIMGVLIILPVVYLIGFVSSFKRNKEGNRDKNAMFLNLYLFILFTAIFFKNMHWPGAGILMITGCASISIHSLFMIILIKKDKNLEIKWLSAVFLVALILNVTYILFRIMHWPRIDAHAFLAIGISVIAAILFFLKIKEKNKVSKFFKEMTGILTVVCVANLFILLDKYEVTPPFYSTQPKIVQQFQFEADFGNKEEKEDARYGEESFEKFIEEFGD